MSGEGGEDVEQPKVVVRHSHTAHILGSRDLNGETTYLVRLRQETDYKYSYFLKTAPDFMALIDQLKKDEQDRMWGEVSEIQVIPEMPKTGRFGFRKALSKIGVSDFLDQQTETIQKGLDQLLGQVTKLSKDSTLSAFFTETSDSEQRRVVTDWALEMRNDVCLLSVMGFWRLAGSKRTWTIHSDGQAHLDGRHRGDQYDFHEEGDPTSLLRSISRKDGWSIDLERSDKDKLLWVSPGKQELEWHRVAKDDAESSLKKVEEIKANMRKKKEEQQQQEQQEEQQKIRATILQRAATSRLERMQSAVGQSGDQEGGSKPTPSCILEDFEDSSDEEAEKKEKPVAIEKVVEDPEAEEKAQQEEKADEKAVEKTEEKAEEKTEEKAEEKAEADTVEKKGSSEKQPGTAQEKTED